MLLDCLFYPRASCIMKNKGKVSLFGLKMLNWNSLTWVDHSNSRRVNNCRVLMKFTMREARAGHGPGLHLSVEARCAGWAHDDDGVVTSVWSTPLLSWHQSRHQWAETTGERERVTSELIRVMTSGHRFTREIRDPHPTPGPITHDCDLRPDTRRVGH